MISLHRYVLIFVVIAVILTGCTDNPNPVTQEVPATLDVSYITYAETVAEFNRDTQEEMTIIEYHFVFPKIEESDDYTSLLLINEYYQMLYRDVMDYGYHQAYLFAKNDYEESKDNDGLFQPHAYGTTYQVSYNENRLLSVQLSEYAYTGGAHPTTFLTSHLFDTTSGDLLTVADLFDTSLDEAKILLTDEIDRQIREQSLSGETLYYDDYERYLKEAFNVHDFYIEKDSLVLYFQQYAIAPYVAGFPKFRIPLTEVPYFISQ